MKRVETPVWITNLVAEIAAHYDMPIPEVVFKIAPPVKFVYGFPKKGPLAGTRVKYQKEIGPGWYSAHAHYPGPFIPNGRLIIRVRDPQLPILGQIVLHEMAHLIAPFGANHSLEFYWHLYSLTEKMGAYAGTNVKEMLMWESDYKVRNAVAGYEAWLASAPLTEKAA